MPQAHHSAGILSARRFTVHGHVQGVGFRPFVYRLAQRHGIHGWVENGMGQVIIHAEGDSLALDNFSEDLIRQAPPAASPVLQQAQSIVPQDLNDFTIRDSHASGDIDIHMVPDLALCEHCRREMRDPADRRYRYPFINCTRCGPRYSVIRQLPYDRANTTMAAFSLCADCAREYHDPAHRRFHAEPVACPACGPALTYHDNARSVTDTQAALQAAMEALHAGAIVAVKGVGGYHLVCDARNDTAVSTLRQRKPRPHKPLALMLSPQQLDDYVQCDTASRAQLTDPVHPVVLLPAQPGTDLADNIAPGLNEIGVMLPYSPLHELLLADFAGPLVMTSANISGEPVLTDNTEVTARLSPVADAYLHHDRTIVRPADDPVYRVIAGQPRPLRLGRGNAPLELDLPCQLAHPVLAVGGHMKNTVALAWERRIVISPHVGDLHAPRSLDMFTRVIDDLQQLYHVQAQQVICDAHHGYASSRWAQRCGLPVLRVPHHHAHAAVLCGEHPDEDRWLVFTWDGVGLGTDGTLWGGEALMGQAGHWQRVASMQLFDLPGGDKAAREPWRSAAALCWQAGVDWQPPVNDAALLRQAWQQRVNCTPTSAVGRLFDAAAALLNLAPQVSFEGQAPMWLEAIASTATAEAAMDLPLQQDKEGIWRSDWSVLLPMLMNEQLPPAQRARHFHDAMAGALVRQAEILRQQHGDFRVGLCGGVFQNRLLTEQVARRLQQQGFRYTVPQHVPLNDAGLCYGQVIEAMTMNRERSMP